MMVHMRTPITAPHTPRLHSTPRTTIIARASMADIQTLSSLRHLPLQYKGVLLDQFGVLHDGLQPYPGAIDAVNQLAAQGRTLLLLSNSSRRAAGALGNLERMGFDPTAFLGVLTSGEVTWQQLSNRQGAFWEGLGDTCLHLTWSQRGAVSLDGLGLTVTQHPKHAQFILAHGTEALGVYGQPAEERSVDQLKQLLDVCATQRPPPPMIVANPDIVTVSGAALRIMPGTLAKHYKAQGGEVHLMGKPAPIIYKAALDWLNLPPQHVIAIGDSLEHDIAGAQGAGVDSVFIAGGIHAGETLAETATLENAGESNGEQGICEEGLAVLCKEHSARPTYAMPYFAW